MNGTTLVCANQRCNFKRETDQRFPDLGERCPVCDSQLVYDQMPQIDRP